MSLTGTIREKSGIITSLDLLLLVLLLPLLPLELLLEEQFLLNLLTLKLNDYHKLSKNVRSTL